MLKSIENNDANVLNDEDLIFKETITNFDKITEGNQIMTEQHPIQNNVAINSEPCHEQQQTSNDSSETVLKTSSRPQRQAAKKAENQIRVIFINIIIYLISNHDYVLIF